MDTSYFIDIAIEMFIWLDFDRSNSNGAEWKHTFALLSDYVVRNIGR